MSQEQDYIKKLEEIKARLKTEELKKSVEKKLDIIKNDKEVKK